MIFFVTFSSLMEKFQNSFNIPLWQSEVNGEQKLMPKIKEEFIVIKVISEHLGFYRLLQQKKQAV